MVKTPATRLIQFLKRVVEDPRQKDFSDLDLLQRFVKDHDEAAFTVLIRRYGRTVFSVCRCMLPCESDAEDAFQATFLVLAQKAESIRKGQSLGSWLYGVAYKTALKARAKAASRRSREAKAPIRSVSSPLDDLTWREAQALLHEELHRLPEEYRAPLVLCFLESRTLDEAAKRLGCGKGALRGKLERARQLLQSRLARRGIGPMAFVGVLAVTSPASADLVVSTAQAASSVAAGGAATAVVSAKVAALTKGVNAMFASKVKIVAAMFLLVGALSGGIWLLGSGGAAIQGQEPKQNSDEAKKSPLKPTQGSEAKDKPKPEVKPVVVGEKAKINSLAWDAKDETVVTVGWTFEVAEIAGPDGKNPLKALLPSSTIKLWGAKTGKLKRSLGEDKGIAISTLTLSPDRKTAVVTAIKFTNEDGKPLGGSRGTEVRLMDAEKWELKRKLVAEGLDAQPMPLVQAVAFSPDGKTLAMGGASSRVKGGCFLKLWDVEKEKLIGGTKETKVGEGFEESVTSLAFSRDGKLLAAGCADGKLRLFDGRTGELKKVWDDDSARWWVVFSPDSKTLVSQSRDKTVKVWDVEKAKVLRTLQGNKASVLAAAFSPDGTLFATGGIVREDDKVTGEVILWDAQTGDLKHTLPGLTMPVSTLSFSPDGKTLAVAGGTSGDLKDGGKTAGEIKLFPLESLTTKRKPCAWGAPVPSGP
jgi:RNA polymerase sigma factor (sigma-70 family)